MCKKMVLTFDEVATRNYLELARKQTQGLVDDGCEPADVTLTVHVSASTIYESSVFFGDSEIGEAVVSWIRKDSEA